MEEKQKNKGKRQEKGQRKQEIGVGNEKKNG